jgi:cytochrome c oxidase assembly protein subunit 15
MFDTLNQEARVFADVSRRRDAKARVVVGSWLAVMAALILVMVMVGGATRLTESGLSMVDWRPVTGFVPPLNDADWQGEFEKYQSSPEYQLVNRGMSLEDFKTIYRWEFWHRNLGRFIGIAFLLPLLFFLYKRFIPSELTPRLIGLFVLGGGQGFLGWYMVQSGLANEPAVSHYRLAAHLSMALILFSAVWWTALDLLTPPPDTKASTGIVLVSWAFLAILAVQIVYGAFVAGLDAGYAYNTWPDMEGAFLPETAFAGQSTAERLTSGTATVQFVHRMLAYGVAAFALALAIMVPRCVADPGASNLAAALIFVVAGQVILGIVTLLKAVPVVLGTLHQGCAVIVLAVSLAMLHRLKQRRVWN